MTVLSEKVLVFPQAFHHAQTIKAHNYLSLKGSGGMASFSKRKMTLLAVCFALSGIPESSLSRPAGTTHFTNPTASGTYGDDGTNIPWPTDNINLSQLQNIFLQNPGISQLNILFPNQSRWGVTPSSLASMTSMFQQEAQNVGINGKLPDLSFSSLLDSTATSSSGLPQMFINPQGDIKSQMDNVLRQARYQMLDLSSSLPDWLKRVLLAIYDAFYSAFEFIGPKLSGLTGR